jgi:hypothetical protein
LHGAVSHEAAPFLFRENAASCFSSEKQEDVDNISKRRVPNAKKMTLFFF